MQHAACEPTSKNETKVKRDSILLDTAVAVKYLVDYAQLFRFFLGVKKILFWDSSSTNDVLTV